MLDATKANRDFKIQTARARVFQNVASVAFLIDKALNRPLPTYSNLEKWLNASSSTNGNLTEAVSAAFAKLVSLILDPDLSRSITRITLSPAEFIVVVYLISFVRESCSDKEIADAVGQLRSIVRNTHADIRMNNTVFKTMFSFVDDFRSNLKSTTKTSSSLKRKRLPDEPKDIRSNRRRTTSRVLFDTACPTPKRVSDPLPIAKRSGMRVRGG